MNEQEMLEKIDELTEFIGELENSDADSRFTDITDRPMNTIIDLLKYINDLAWRYADSSH